MEFPKIRSNSGIEVLVYNACAGGRAAIHGAYLADTPDFKWVPWAWTAKGESFPLQIHDLDITLAVASGEVVVNG